MIWISQIQGIYIRSRLDLSGTLDLVKWLIYLMDKNLINWRLILESSIISLLRSLER